MIWPVAFLVTAMASLSSTSANIGTCGAPASNAAAFTSYSLSTAHSGLSSFYEHKAALLDGSNVEFSNFAVSSL